MSRIIAAPSGCSHCRIALLKAYISNPGFPPQPTTRSSARRVGASHLSAGRSFSTLHSWRSDLVQQRQLPENEAAEEAERLVAKLTTNLAETASDEDGAGVSTTSAPWYLQIATPQGLPNPLLKRQQIPEIPSNPPPLLKPMLEHISVDLGLDDLVLLDLRKIDPPPALGANLLMLLGTARSEKHLHVSADRFCRWLKTTHNLSPYADGLLGRGELKLKLRRKARRARLLSNVGSSDTSHADEGIRTGWICVNVGTIDDGRPPIDSFTEQEGYVGFGGEAGGAKVVIQMLTAEKREELDLEGLWGKMQRRQEKKEERASKGQEELPKYQEADPTSFNRERSSSDLLPSLSSSLFKPSTNRTNPRRRYHRQYILRPCKVVSTKDWMNRAWDLVLERLKTLLQNVRQTWLFHILQKFNTKGVEVILGLLRTW